jgi:hypothetical protein
LFHCFQPLFLQLWLFYWYTWKHISCTCICVYRCIFSSFLGLCWRYKSIDKDHQKNPPSLPFAHPRAKAKTLVVDQELLQCRLHFKYARFITKFSTAIWMNWLSCLPVITLLFMGLLAFSSLG